MRVRIFIHWSIKMEEWGCVQVFSGILYSDNFEIFYQTLLLIIINKTGLYDCQYCIHMNLFL